MKQIKLSMLDVFVEKDGDEKSPGEINFVLYVANQEVARSNWEWPIDDGGRRAYGADILLSTDLNNIPIRFDVHEDDTWPEKDDYARADLNIDMLKTPGRNAWKIQAISQNQNLNCTLSFVLEVEAPIPAPQTITAYEDVDAGGNSANLLDPRFAQILSKLPQAITLYRINCRDLAISNDRLSSMYVPEGDYEITLFEHAPNDLAFSNGKRYDLPFKGPYLLNLTEVKYPYTQINCNDSVSYIEIKHTKAKKIGRIIDLDVGKINK
jgi:hypothetical protein